MYIRTLFMLLVYFLIVSVAYAQKQTEYIFPTTPFNKEETSKLLETGTGIIRGNAFLKRKGRQNFSAKGNTLTLFPVTPYFTEWLELRKKYKQGKKVPVLSNEAYSYRIEGKFIDDKGGFEFTNLKPGRYYVMATIMYANSGTYSYQSGTSVTSNIYGQVLNTAPIYSSAKYFYSSTDEVNTLVDVPGNGQVVHITVSN